LGHPVVAVGPPRRVGVENIALLVEADHMVRTREHDALHAMPACALIYMEHAFDIGLEDLLERPLHRHAAQVDDRFATAYQSIDRGLIGEVAWNDLLGGSGR